MKLKEGWDIVRHRYTEGTVDTIIGAPAEVLRGRKIWERKELAKGYRKRGFD